MDAKRMVFNDYTPHLDGCQHPSTIHMDVIKSLSKVLIKNTRFD
jgi:hypothetical protein